MAGYPLPRRLVAMMATVVVILLVAGILFLREQERSMLASAENNLSVVARLKVGEIVQWRGDRVSDAEVLAKSPPFVSLVAEWLRHPSGGEEEVMLASLQSMTLHMTYDSALVFDSTGKLRLSAGSFSGPVPIDVSSTVEQSLREGKALLIDIYMDSDGEPQVGVVSPVFAPVDTGFPVAALVLLTDAEQFLYPLVQSWPTTSASAETLLVRRDGDSVLFLNDVRHQKGAALVLRYPLTDTTLPAVMAVLGVEGVVEGTDYRDVTVIADVRPVPDSPWFMVAKVDKAEVVSALHSTSTMIVVLILALVAVAVAIFGFLWQRRQKSYYFRLLAAQKEGAESEQRFRLLVENSPDAIFVQTSGRFAYVNAAAVRLFAASTPEDLVGTPVLERVPSQLREASRARITLINRDKRSIPHFETVYLTMSGTPVPVESTAVPIHFQGGDGSLVFVRDVTERQRRMEALRRSEEALRSLNLALEEKVAERTAQLEASNKELEAFAYSVSHDLRAPLRAIEGFSRILLEDYSEVLDAEGKRLFGVVRSSTARMDRLITDLLQLSRVSQTELRPVSVDMMDLVQSVREELLSEGIGGETEFVLGDLPEAEGDPTLLKRVWHNLLSNAFKFTAQSEIRRVEVGGQADNNSVTYHVRDTGVGFDPKYVHQLYGVFQRLHSRDQFEGTGIGLAIVQRIIHRHGGRVWAEGEIGRGATFYFALPRGVAHHDG